MRHSSGEPPLIRGILKHQKDTFRKSFSSTDSLSFSTSGNKRVIFETKSDHPLVIYWNKCCQLDEGLSVPKRCRSTLIRILTILGTIVLLFSPIFIGLILINLNRQEIINDTYTFAIVIILIVLPIASILLANCYKCKGERKIDG